MNAEKSKQLMGDYLTLQDDYRRLKTSGKMTKKAICDLVNPFKNRYDLTDIQALQIARGELDSGEIIIILSESVRKQKQYDRYVENGSGDICFAYGMSGHCGPECPEFRLRDGCRDAEYDEEEE